MPNFFDDYYYSEFNSGSCVKVLYMKFATKIEYVQDNKKKFGILVNTITNGKIPLINL